jgi:hypothetical protein
MHSQIDVARGLVLARGWDTLTDQDVLGSLRAVATDPRFRPDMRHLIDFRDITKLDITSVGVRTAADNRYFGAGARRAFVLGSESAYGMARMYQILRDTAPDTLELFREPEPALEWLGLSRDAAEVLAALAALRPSAP